MEHTLICKHLLNSFGNKLLPVRHDDYQVIAIEAF
jgi:hypothetical protein